MARPTATPPGSTAAAHAQLISHDRSLLLTSTARCRTVAAALCCPLSAIRHCRNAQLASKTTLPGHLIEDVVNALLALKQAVGVVHPAVWCGDVETRLENLAVLLRRQALPQPAAVLVLWRRTACGQEFRLLLSQAPAAACTCTGGGAPTNCAVAPLASDPKKGPTGFGSPAGAGAAAGLFSCRPRPRPSPAPFSAFL